MMRCLIAVILVICGISSGARAQEDRVSVRHFIGHPSLSTNPVDIHIGSAHWRVPRNYLETASVNRGTGEVFFTLLMSFSDFAGATKDTLPCFRTSRLRCRNIVVMRRARGTARTFYDKLSTAMSAGSIPHDEIHSLAKIEKGEGLPPGEYYLYRGKGTDDAVAIFCNSPSSKVRYCRGSVDLTGGIRIVYEYGPERLPDWQAIHSGIVRLFERFRVRDEQ